MIRVFIPWNNEWIELQREPSEDHAAALRAWVYFLASPDEMTKPLMSWWTEPVEVV